MRVLIALFIVLCCLPQVTLALEGPTLIDTLIADSKQTWFGKTIVAAGDQNGDGYDDFLVWEAPWNVYLFHGGNPLPTTPALLVDDTSTYRVSVLPDFMGDGSPEVAVNRWIGNYQLRLALFQGGSSLALGPAFQFGTDTLSTGASFIHLGNDINHNGQLELVARHYDQATLEQYSLLFFELGSALDSIPDVRLFPPNQRTAFFGDAYLLDDYNADGYEDLIVNYRPSTANRVFLYWGGPDFDTLPDLIINRSNEPDSFTYTYQGFGSQLVALGDINGDSYPDFYLGYLNGSAYDTLSFIHFGGPAIDVIPDVTIAEACQKGRLAGDVNNDGYPDFITGATSSSAFGYANIYFGGPDMDSIPDVHIDHSAFPGYLNYFAHEVAGLGDVNGDGIDDFAIASLQGTSRPGLIFVMAGWGDSVGVNDPDDPALPTDFTLYQNYPNPFNPATTIGFALPRTSTITLRILNPLGQTVTVLLDHQRLGPGEHQVTWEAEEYASGIYLYELEYSTGTRSRKMLLLK